MATGSYIADKQTTELKLNTFKSRWAFFEGHIRLWMVGALVAADLLGLFAAIYLALQIRRWLGDLLPAYIFLSQTTVSWRGP
jgi:hypothetical protein